MKRIVICADGTWNLRDQVDEKTGKRRPTNVTKLARAVRSKSAFGIEQVVFYHDGVGTSGGADKYTGGAFGHGVEDNVRDIYRFILYNYVAGDELYLFGFSRGAFTVRTLAGFMHQVGLLEKDDDYYVPEIYACYESSALMGSDSWKHAFRKVSNPLPAPPIRMMGVWDTVGSLGAPGLLGQLFNRGKYQYHDVSLTPEIEHAYHALAIDERRKNFAPSIWKRPPDWSGTLQQVWFPGVHCNIGGGYSPDGLANEALHWMVEKAEALGLEFDSTYLQFFTPCFNSTLFDSKTGMYRALGTHERQIGKHPGHGEAIHQSAVDRFELKSLGYEPSTLKSQLRSLKVPIVNTTRITRGVPC